MKDIVFKTIMLKGEAGGTISKIELTSSVNNVDTYTIYLNDGTTQTFEVTNGSSIESIEKTSTSGLVDTYTITLTSGETFSFDVTNGQDAYYYEVPTGSVFYYDSSDPTPQGYEQTINPDGAVIQDLVDKTGLIWLHDEGTNRVFMSGELDAVGAWIISQLNNLNYNKWIGARISPTDSTGYFGSSSFTVMANCSSANYGVAQFMSDNPNVSPIVIGQLREGTWTFVGTSEGSVMQMTWASTVTSISANTYVEIVGQVEMSPYTDGYTAKGFLLIDTIYPDGVYGVDFVTVCGSNIYDDNGVIKAKVGFYNPTDHSVNMQCRWRILYFKN